MGERIIELLLSGMKRLRKALSRCWERRAPVAEAGQSETYTDQW